MPPTPQQNAAPTGNVLNYARATAPTLSQQPVYASSQYLRCYLKVTTSIPNYSKQILNEIPTLGWHDGTLKNIAANGSTDVLF